MFAVTRFQLVRILLVLSGIFAEVILCFLLRPSLLIYMFASGHILMLVKISRDSNDVNNSPEKR